VGNMVRGPQAKRRSPIILTTHYIQEAQEMADRIGVISKGEIILIEEKTALMKKLGKKKLTLQLRTPLRSLAADLGAMASRAQHRRDRARVHIRHFSASALASPPC